MTNHWVIAKQIRKTAIRRKLFKKERGRKGSKESPFGHGKVKWVQCHYCGCWLRLRGKNQHDHATIAHLTPVCYGGEYTIDNLVFACYECDQLDGRRYNYLGYHFLRYLALPVPPQRLALPAP